ncbi:hypothetical protein OH76DRAFT_264912 [Lentinus brumalis]|uniref:Secreted protein n=1 Tax=Lentinus brumalis TaxID=2498619 RepID=A0A371DGS1_9APHY|nr:hypothetical protein OH76DRAFT_264912 [Polyporus brumalis]
MLYFLLVGHLGLFGQDALVISTPLSLVHNTTLPRCTCTVIVLSTNVSSCRCTDPSDLEPRRLRLRYGLPSACALSHTSALPEVRVYIQFYTFLC